MSKTSSAGRWDRLGRVAEKPMVERKSGMGKSQRVNHPFLSQVKSRIGGGGSAAAGTRRSVFILQNISSSLFRPRPT